jgi:hypothetical protein
MMVFFETVVSLCFAVPKFVKLLDEAHQLVFTPLRDAGVSDEPIRRPLSVRGIPEVQVLFASMMCHCRCAAACRSV